MRRCDNGNEKKKRISLSDIHDLEESDFFRVERNGNKSLSPVYASSFFSCHVCFVALFNHIKGMRGLSIKQPAIPIS